MKRKFINALVFGALLVAPAGSFVSCSDYDDDISSLRSDLDETKQNLQSLVDGRIATIETEISNLKTADENLAAAVEEAKGLIATGDAATLEGARALVEDAKRSLEEALKDTAASLAERDAELQLAIADAQGKADAASTLANEVKATADAALSTANENKAQLEALSQKLEGIDGNLADILDGLEQSVKTLTDDMLQAQSDITRIDAALLAQQATLDALEEWKGTADADLTQAKEDIAQLQEDLAQQKAELEKYVDDAVAIVSADVDDLRDDVDDLKAAYAAADENLQEQINNLNTSLSDLDTKVDGIETSISNLETKLDENINVLQTLLKNALRGLVFSPEMFVDGIEAQEYAYAQYNPLVATPNGASSGTNPDNKTFTITDLNSGATTWRYGQAVNTLTINPVTTLTYHMNPSSAKVAFGDLDFVSKDVQVITRSAAANPRTAENDLAGNKVFSCSNGLLKVGVVANGPSIEQTDATILALQAKVNQEGEADTLITSDYAMLYATQVTFDEIVFTDGTDAVDCAGTEDGLYKTAVEAVERTATHKIVYTDYGDDATGLDLKSKVALHYTHDTKSDKKVTHKVMSQEEAAKYGLTFDFKLINYTVGNNKTSDSKYATIDETTGVLKTRTVDEDGNTIVPGDDNLAAPAIGREPLVRVRVMQGSNVVLVGFIKVDIIQKDPEALEDITAGIFDGGSQPVAACGNPSDVTTTWSWTSANILGTLGLDIAEFHERYELELNGTGEVKQYSAPGTESTDYLGVATEKPEEQGSVTTVLNWNLSAADRQTIWEATDHTATIYVKYVPKANYMETNPAVYVGLKVAITKPAAGTLGDKATGYWEGDRVKLNVHYPLDGKKVSDFYFDYDLDDFWKDKIVKFSRSDVASGDYKYYFDPSMTTVAGRNVTLKNSLHGRTFGVTRGIQTMDGRWVDWTPENEFNYQIDYRVGVYTLDEVWVGNTKIATLNQANGIVKYENNEVAKQMLNSGRLAVELKIAIAGQNSCNQVVPTTGNTFTAALYRPVNLAAAADIPHFVDAANNGSSVNVFDMLSFTDWRNEAFTGSNGWLFGYYEISRVYIGTDDGGSDDASFITTTVGGGQLGQDKLTRYPEIVVSLTGNTAINVSNCTEANSAAIIDKVKKQLGKITVKNTGASVATYQLRVPLTIEYAWGKLTVDVDLTVDSTMQSNRK